MGSRILKRKSEIGDICEIVTPAGLAYIQYTHDIRGSGQLVRVLPGLHDARPRDFAELARQPELYFIFYTLNYALRDHQTEIVSHQPVPNWAQRYPLMRWGVPDQNGEILAWKIFEASTPLTVENHLRTPVLRVLTREQHKLSIRELWPHPVMVRELARGWTPERAEELRLRDIAEADEKKDLAESGESREKPMRHVLYFPRKSNAEKAGERLRKQGFSVEVRKGSGGKNWLALAARTAPQTGEQMTELREGMETIAVELGGEYDGWELAVDPGPASGDHAPTVN